MGYDSTFEGEFRISPPLNEAEMTYLHAFARTRHMRTRLSPYNTTELDYADGMVIDANEAPNGVPGLWCQWVPNDDGDAIVWDEGEKFYDSEEWIAWLIEHLLKPGAVAQQKGDDRFVEFTFDHVVNGTVEVQGEEPADKWAIRVRDNVVSSAQGRVVYDDEEE